MKITIEGPQGCGKTIIAGIIGNVLKNLGCQRLSINHDGSELMPFACGLSEDDLIRVFSNQGVSIKIVDAFNDEKIDSSHRPAGCETELVTEQSAIPSEELHGHALDTNQSQNNSSEETYHTSCKSSCRLGRPQDLHADNTSS